MKTSTLLIFTAILSLTFTAGCGGNSPADEASSDTSGEPDAIPAAVRPGRALLSEQPTERATDPGTFEQLSFSTILTAKSKVKVLSRISGLVESVREEGDRIKKGDILARLDDEPYRLALRKAVAEAQRTRTTYFVNLEGFRQRYEIGVISEQELKISEAEYMKAQADSALKEMELGYAAIRAPINGYITERKIQPGQWIGTYDELFTVADLDILWAVFVVPYDLQTTLREGQSLRLLVRSGSGSTSVDGLLHLKNPVIDPTGGVKITIQIINREGRLRPGMPVELVLE